MKELDQLNIDISNAVKPIVESFHKKHETIRVTSIDIFTEIISACAPDIIVAVHTNVVTKALR